VSVHVEASLWYRGAEDLTTVARTPRNAANCGVARKTDLGQYAQRFAENDISFSILSDLTDQDLKEIGVSSLGHRRQLLRAIVSGSRKVRRSPPLQLPQPLHREIPLSVVRSLLCFRT
jgi:hypothetical protein